MNSKFKYLSRVMLTTGLLALSNSGFAANTSNPTGWYYTAWDTTVSPTVYMKIGNFTNAAFGGTSVSGYNACQQARLAEFFDSDTITSGSSCALSNWGSDIVSYEEELSVIDTYIEEINTLNAHYGIAEYQEEVKEIHAKIFRHKTMKRD